MLRTKLLEQSVLGLGAGEFQRLGDAILERKGYKEKRSLGTHSGSGKPTRGIPDTYFITQEGSYILVAYTTTTTKKFEKIKQDLQDCLDTKKLGIKLNQIAEIISFHTSNNITIKQNEELKTIAKNANVKLTQYGLDGIVQELNKYPQIAEEFFNIPADTNQITNLEMFIKNHDAIETVVPLQTKFVAREEFNNIWKSIEEQNVTMITGKPGVGKSRLAIEVCREYVKKNSEWELLCIKNRRRDLFPDLEYKINRNSKYILLIDDANQVKELRSILEHITAADFKDKIKIIATVRDYACDEVQDVFNQYFNFQPIKLSKMENKYIKQLISGECKIYDNIIIKLILNIAKGNPRFAIMASKIVVRDQSLEGIVNPVELYERYFKEIITKISDNGEMTLKVAGVLSFFSHIDLDAEVTQNILNLVKLTKDEFKRECLYLHDLEIVDKHNDNLFKFSDEPMQNYLLYEIFYRKKLISLSAIIQLVFPNYKEAIVYSCNTLANIFHSGDMNNFLKKEIEQPWNKYQEENNKFFLEFVKMFAQLKQSETLLILKKEIDSIEKENYLITEEDFAFDDRQQSYGEDIIIDTLASFRSSEELATAIDLVVLYFFKNPSVFHQTARCFYHFRAWGIQEDSHLLNYSVQKKIVNKFQELLKDYSDHNLVILFLKVAQNYFKFEYEQNYLDGTHFNMNHFSLAYNQDVIEYRTHFWEIVIKIYNIEIYKPFIHKILEDYSIWGYSVIQDYDKRNREIAINVDKPYLEKIINKMDENSLGDCLIIEKLDRDFNIIESPLTNIDFFLNNEVYILYKILMLGDQSSRDEFKSQMSEYLENISWEKYPDFFAKMRIISNLGRKCYHCEDSLKDIMQNQFYAHDNFWYFVKLYIEYNQPFSVHPLFIIDLLIKKYGFSDTEKMLLEIEFDNKNDWLFILYSVIPEELANQKYLDVIYELIKGKNKTSEWNTNLKFLDKFLTIDSEVYIKVTDLFLEKTNDIFYQNIHLLFKKYNFSPQQLTERFNNNIQKLKVLYFSMMRCYAQFDHDLSYLSTFTKLDMSFIDFIIERKMTGDNIFYFGSNYHRKDLSFIWSYDDFEKYLDYIEEKYIVTYSENGHKIRVLFDEILSSDDMNKIDVDDKRQLWIENFIERYAMNETFIKYFFDVLVNALTRELFVKELLMLVNINNNFEMFVDIPLFPNSRSFSDAIAMWEKDQRYLNDIKNELKGIQYLEHRNYLEKQIHYLNIDKKRWQERNFLTEI